jgi:ubiquinone/menaquinone biosynthesis C-methylase UbiE
MLDLDLEKQYFNRAWAGVDTNIAVQSALRIPGIPSLAGKTILVCSCGSGIPSVEAANAGAIVYAVDISEAAVANAEAFAAYNKVDVHCSVQDLHQLNFADEFFDVVYGSAVLHHLEIKRACQEFKRVLKPGGIAVFTSEPTLRNPLIKAAYEGAFGKGREGRRRSFLFMKRTGTDNEKPLDKQEFSSIERQFHDVSLAPRGFMLFQKLSHVTGGALLGVTSRIDRTLLRLFPSIKYWSYEYDLFLRK